jgi:hypothetical protein
MKWVTTQPCENNNSTNLTIAPMWQKQHHQRDKNNKTMWKEQQH